MSTLPPLAALARTAVNLFTAIIVCALVAPSAPSLAQGPLDKLIGNNSKNLSRLPDDQIEGTIWEYKGTLRTDRRRDQESEADEAGDQEKKDKLEGRFRFEENAVFDVSRRLDLPSRDKVRGVLDSLREGEAQELKLPSGSKAKRIGSYRHSRNRLRLDLDDKKALFGVMVLRPKKNTSDIWQGTFQEKEGKRTVRTWQVEIRPVED